MKKYLSIFKVSFEQEFVYRLNFIMWRVRNVMQILLVFFLWSAIFSDPEKVLFGYSRERIITYVFGILIVRALVFSSRSIDIAGEIARGDLSNYILKPINYFRYWMTRDLSSKALNLFFAIFEMTLLFILLKPPLFFQTNPLTILYFIIFILFSIYLFFCMMFLVNMVAFWMPENGWAAQFLFMVIFTEFLSGNIFPIDILPVFLQKILYLFPFPYLLFFPLQIYLGKIVSFEIFKGLLVILFWSILLSFMVKNVWNKGLKNYTAEGR